MIRDVILEDTFDHKFTTRAFSTGVPTVLAGTPVISAYPGNSVTQLTAGITLSVDLDGVVGLNNIRVVATAANGYADATDYALVITTGTVGGTSVVGEVVGHFRIGRSPAFRRLGAPAGASVSADVAAVKVDTAAILVDTGTTLQAEIDGVQADTEDIQARLPAALVGGRIDATVDATGMEAGAIDAILDDTIGDGTLTVRQALRVAVAALAAKLSGAATTTVTIRNVADTANVIVATVDADGNRSATTVTP